MKSNGEFPASRQNREQFRGDGRYELGRNASRRKVGAGAFPFGVVCGNSVRGITACLPIQYRWR
jgi:hypothetical protein